jgi:molybdopterin molybdotransferase
MITVQQAEKIILDQTRDYGVEDVPFELALGRVLAADIRADRDLPPYNRATMDGIAISFNHFEKGTRTFRVKAVQAAGDHPVPVFETGDCIEIMTGAALHESVDTVVRYEDLEIKDGFASLLTDSITRAQSIHQMGKDRKQQEVVAGAFQYVTPAIISIAASVGASILPVMRLPRTVIISSGDELVDVNDKPLPFQVRRSNNYTVQAVLKLHGLPSSMIHIPDDAAIIHQELQNCLEKYDVILLSGGISMGKFDFIPRVLEKLSVHTLFHKVSQRPGKPFWFGKKENGPLVFAFPGNPVATFMCLHRYFLPWLESSLNVRGKKELYAALSEDFNFSPPLQYFLQVKLTANRHAQLLAEPTEGNGSGDFANLVDTDAFLELPLDKINFRKGEVFRVWPFK